MHSLYMENIGKRKPWRTAENDRYNSDLTSGMHPLYWTPNKEDVSCYFLPSVRCGAYVIFSDKSCVYR